LQQKSIEHEDEQKVKAFQKIKSIPTRIRQKENNNQQQKSNLFD